MSMDIVININRRVVSKSRVYDSILIAIILQTEYMLSEKCVVVLIEVHKNYIQSH